MNFAKFLRTPFKGTPPFDNFWIEYKYNDTKTKRINMKHNYILLHFIKFFYRASPVAASGYLHYFLSLLFFTFSIFPFRSSHRKCSIKNALLIILNILRQTPPLESLLIKSIPATSLKRNSNTGVFL